jgi:hypothetical protein
MKGSPAEAAAAMPAGRQLIDPQVGVRYTLPVAA